MQLHSLLAKTADFLNTGFEVVFYLRKQAKNCIDTGSGPEQNKKTEKKNFKELFRYDQIKDYEIYSSLNNQEGGKKYSASTIITKKQKLYPHWIKKYKINTKYFVPGIKF